MLLAGNSLTDGATIIGMRQRRPLTVNFQKLRARGESKKGALQALLLF
jgi:hypothetical protein